MPFFNIFYLIYVLIVVALFVSSTFAIESFDRKAIVHDVCKRTLEIQAMNFASIGISQSYRRVPIATYDLNAIELPGFANDYSASRDLEVIDVTKIYLEMKQRLSRVEHLRVNAKIHLESGSIVIANSLKEEADKLEKELLLELANGIDLSKI